MQTWLNILFRESVLEIFLEIDQVKEKNDLDPYTKRTCRQFRKVGLLDKDLNLTEKGSQVHSSISNLFEKEQNELEKLKKKAKLGVSMVEKGRILRKLSAMEKAASSEEQKTIDQIRDNLSS